MLLTFFSFLMRFVDISKLHSERCNCTNGADDCQNKVKCWQQAAAAAAAAAAHKANVAGTSNSSSTSSGCDSSASSASGGSSSKENFYALNMPPKQRRQQQRQQQQQLHRQAAQHQTITPEQLEQIRYYQQMQQQQLQILQQQLLQRRLLQQHLREQGVDVGVRTRLLSTENDSVGSGVTAPQARLGSTNASAALTCNQQYLMQQRLQQQQQQQQPPAPPSWLRNNHNYNSNNQHNNNVLNSNNDILNNNDDFAVLLSDIGVGHQKGQKFRRGMTEFSTNNDINNKSHLSQPLQNSPRHYAYSSSQTKQTHHHHQPNLSQQPHPNSPQHYANNINSHFNYQAFKQTHNNKNNLQTLPLNSSANTFTTTTTTSHINSNITTSPTSATQSPLHYKKPLNSPNNSPFAFAYNNYGENEREREREQQQRQQQQQQRSSNAAATAQQHQLQQHLRSSKTLPLLTQTQYQQHLNDLLLQQQHLQKHQQQLLSAKDADDELSEESLKQNVAIVLNNLDRYNNALRSIILNEQVSGQSSVLIDDSLLVESLGANNNFLLNSGGNNTMAAPATPESDYNSNATTPGSRHSMPLDSNMLQQHQHLVGFANAAAAAAATACGGGGGVGVSNNINGVGGGGGYLGNNLNYSIASSHDFTHDNSDYQWLLDCDYRDGCGTGLQRSIFSSISGSYSGDIIFYNDFSKKLDANLAEVDMESFRAEDILLHMPSYCKNMSNSNRLQQSFLLQQHALPLNAQEHGGIGGVGGGVGGGINHLSTTSLTSNNELIDNSICKSELLFSPVKESHLSADSLDMDAYPENEDIILTCKANKDNYTIAFEGSVLYSDESFYAEPSDVAARNTHNFINLHSNLEDIVKRKALDVSMSRSEQAASVRGKLQKSNTTQLQRYPSGNNNTAANNIFVQHIQHTPNCTVRKSRSVPNLRDHKDPTAMVCSGIADIQQQKHHSQQQQLNVSQAVSTSNMECCKTSRNLLPMCQMPISSNSIIASITSERLNAGEQLQTQHQQHQQQQETQQQQNAPQQRHKHRCSCQPPNAVTSAAAAAATNSHNCPAAQKHAPISGSASSGSSNPPAFNLVKLFIKQKSNQSATDEQQMSTHTCMDVSSGCWPSSDAAGSSSSSSLEQRLRKKSMNDSGKGSALSRHDEDEEQLCAQVRDTCESAFQAEPHHGHAGHPTPTRRHLRIRNDAVFYDEDPSSSSSGSLTATNSPAHRRRSMPPRHPQLCQLVTQHKDVGTACSLQSSENSRSNSEQLTQVYVSTGTSSTTLERQRSRCEGAQPTVSAASSSELISRSMQTSCGSLSTRSSMSDRFRFVPPSFLAKLNNLGEERQAPIYVIYPNYALPDLGFVKTNSTADVIFSPFNYKMAVGSNDDSASMASLKKRVNLNSNDDEILKNMDYKHVVDWQSLTTLLPADYRRRLKHIPEVNTLLPDLDAELSQRPLFCMSPPIRRNRPHICDCAQYFQQQQQHTTQTGEEGSSSSASSQQPSSGYRGSSTLLADSADLENADPLKQMYIYQYEQQRMDSGVEMSPAAGRTPPQPMPRGILRKSSSHSANRTKRNSMIEGQQSKLTKQEKRRSLQEPPYHHAIGSSEELGEVFEEEAELYAVPQPRQERLSRKDLDARMRLLSSLPRSELKCYAEIAAILESSTEYQVAYDPAALKKEVSRALSQQKKVSFNDIHTLTENEPEVGLTLQQQQTQQQPLLAPEARQRFTTPPNSPNISVAGGPSATRRSSQMEQHQTAKRLAALDEQEKRKIESNRFKRLQIQWELMSKDSTMLKELASAQETKSGGSTPTATAASATAAAAAAAAANAAHKSRIPRPVSYPAGKARNANCNMKPVLKQLDKVKTTKLSISPQIGRISTQEADGKTTRSPSRIVPPKRYSMTAAVTNAGVGVGVTRARTPNSRAAVTAPNTPKRRVQSPRTTPRVR
ncbi:probable serine/threonine-protein kinase DDB_G0282963 isoform X1 [Zeugodacus cucurbitae]|nr:probable serine/threonine-protein kinase DDB_G0282963 isoform X1 [Zeugodacus cucurbitae]